MSARAWALVFGVALFNVLLNFQLYRTAQAISNWLDGVYSGNFLLAFLIGCCSLASLYALYLQDVSLPRAITLAGALSIIGGTLFGFAIRKQIEFDPVEWALFALMVLFYMFRLRRLSA
jgi:hypothetical protein